jgi:hypothetical protein
MLATTIVAASTSGQLDGAHEPPRLAQAARAEAISGWTAVLERASTRNKDHGERVWRREPAARPARSGPHATGSCPVLPAPREQGGAVN